ncbi:MAG: type II toxin-antitoxin system RelE/ParE family toxin [Verrucomicrobiota bacterium]
MRVTLTELAQEDWRSIRRYLRRQFGSRVEMAAASQVRAARIAIGENPGRGHSIESAVFPGWRGIVVKKSLICYRILSTHVQIVRILEVRQDTWTVIKAPRTPSKEA